MPPTTMQFLFLMSILEACKKNALIRQRLHRGQVEIEEQYHSLIPVTLDGSSRESFFLGRIIMI